MFDYSKLKGAIKEKLGTQKCFADRIGISYTSLYQRLSGELYFSQDEMIKAIEVLGEPMERVEDLFFTPINTENRN